MLAYLKQLATGMKSNICLPRLRRQDVIDTFNTETPHVLIQECFEREDGDEEGNLWVEKLVQLIIKTESFKLIIASSGDLGFDGDMAKKILTWILNSCYKETELLGLPAALELVNEFDVREVSALV